MQLVVLIVIDLDGVTIIAVGQSLHILTVNIVGFFAGITKQGPTRFFQSSATRKKQYKKNYGKLKAIRVLLHYGLVATKKIRKQYLDQIIDVNGYKLALIPGDLGISSELMMFKTHEPLSLKICLRNSRT